MRKAIQLLSVFLFLASQARGQQLWDRSMQLVSCDISITAGKFTATTFMELEFHNPDSTEMEGLYRFELAPGQVVTAFQLDLHGKYRDGSIEEKWKATRAYNTIVGKRIDPALLTWDYDNHYSLRIYPVPPRGSRRVTLTIHQLLKQEGNELVYHLPLSVKGTVSRFNLNIQVSADRKPEARPGWIQDRPFAETAAAPWTLRCHAAETRLNEPISFSIPLDSTPKFCSMPVIGGHQFAVRWPLDLPSHYENKPGHLLIFWDASDARHNRNLNREIDFLQQYISQNNVSQLTIIPFNHRIMDTATFYTAKGFSNGWKQWLRALPSDGATQLGLINIPHDESGTVMIFSDGYNSYGRSRPQTGKKIVYCVNSSDYYNVDLLTEICGTSGGAVIDLHRIPMKEAVTKAGRVLNWWLGMRSAGNILETDQSFPVSPARNLLLTGTIAVLSDTIILEFGNSSGPTRTEKILLRDGQTCVEEDISRIPMLKQFAAVIRTSDWNHILDFGLMHKVVTPHTAYIVLERVEDYIKYNITPPADLQEECERLNYVRVDTRAQRRMQAALDDHAMGTGFLKAYNKRLLGWDPSGHARVDESVVMTPPGQVQEAGGYAHFNTGTGNLLTGPAKGLNITSNSLDEVVVVAYGLSRKADMTASIQVIRNSDIFSSARSVEQALQGRVAGLEVRGGFAPGSGSGITLRGMGSFHSGNQPLFVLDGFPVTGNINDLVNVTDINDITVMKGLSASAIYGSRAAQGAILINTKKSHGHYRNNYNQSYRLKDMEDVEYLRAIADASAPEEKRMVYNQLRSDYGDEPAFYWDMARHFHECGMIPDALSTLMLAAEMGRGRKDAGIVLAWFLESWKRYEEAEMVLEDLLAEYARDISIYRDLAWVRYGMGDYQEAVETFYAGLTMNYGLEEQWQAAGKAGLLDEMNAIIHMHRDSLDLRFLPASLIRPMPVDLRITLQSNTGSAWFMEVDEPGNSTAGSSYARSRNGGFFDPGQSWYGGEYRIRKAPAGRYRVRVQFYNYKENAIPCIIRARVFHQYGKTGHTMYVENIMMDNQLGLVEVLDLVR